MREVRRYNADASGVKIYGAGGKYHAVTK